jgi:hypothetical protein
LLLCCTVVNAEGLSALERFSNDASVSLRR